MSGLERVDDAVTSTLTRVNVPGEVSAERLVQMAEFGAVGASGAVVNLMAFVTLAPHVGFFLAGFVAFFTGVVWTFTFNWSVTFRGQVTDDIARRFVRYVGVCSIGYALYSATLTGTVSVVGLPYWLSGVSAVSASGLWNYFGSEQFALA